MGDVLNTDGSIKQEIRLNASQTKGNEARVVFIPQKLRDEFVKYLATRKIYNPEIPFFHSSGFSGLISEQALITHQAIQAADHLLHP